MATVVIEKDILTTIGRILVHLARVGGKDKMGNIRKATSSQAYASVLKAERLGLLKFDPDTRIVELTARGREIARCLLECIERSHT